MSEDNGTAYERIPAWKLIHLKRAGVVAPGIREMLLDRLREAMEYDETEE